MLVGLGVHFVHVGRGRVPVHMRVDWGNIPGAHSWGLYARSFLGICKRWLNLRRYFYFVPFDNKKCQIPPLSREFEFLALFST